MHKRLIFIPLLFLSYLSQGQFLMDMIDTTTELGKGMMSIYKKYDHVRISGYIQTQFQQASAKGAQSFNGGDFPVASDNRFTIRRGRLRFDYEHVNEANLPTAAFVFQFDGSERGVFIRDFYGRLFENKWSMFSITAGMFARPFGYEVNLASPDRESPERGRMSQLLMRTERDLGAMVSFEPLASKHWARYLKIDAGLFNGPGLASTTDYDSFKDFITRVRLKPVPLKKKLFLSGGLSYFEGAVRQDINMLFRNPNDVRFFTPDRSIEKIGSRLPRRYGGVDIQLKKMHGFGATEIRGEFWKGTQTARGETSETPAGPTPAPLYIRQFQGGFFYFLTNIYSPKHQLGFKFDWYDPNTDLKGEEISQLDQFNAAEVRFDTYGFGYIHNMSTAFKLMLWYEIVRNERTGIPGLYKDADDNVFTARMQFRF